MMPRAAQISKLSKPLRVLLPVVISIVCLAALFRHVELPPFLDLCKLAGQIPMPNWIGAIGATALSFWALGRYDAVAHRHLRTGLDGARARHAGMAAIAFSQTVGFGIFTGAFARWRLIPELSPLQAAQLTAFVGITFLSALAAICGLSLILTAKTLNAALLGGLVILGVLAVAAICFLVPELRIKRFSMRLPSLRAMAALSLWTLIDIACAGFALWLLLPEGHGISITALLPAYFLALGLAIVSSSPGGAGPLELALLALLPQADPATLIAGLLAFRIVYYAVPALVAGAFLLWPDHLPLAQLDLVKVRVFGRASADQEKYTANRGRMTRQHHNSHPPHSLPYERAQGEIAIIRQNGGHILAAGLNKMAVLDSPQISVAFFDPFSGVFSEAPEALSLHAQSRNSAACFYKCSGRMALAARAKGWRVLRIASDAIINPLTYSDAGSSHRQLRRKLRQAEKAGLEVRAAGDTLPFGDMRNVNDIWVKAHGRALGTTMGQFEEGYVGRQLTFLARQDGRLIGFVTFHQCSGEWALDLVRLRPDAPDGTGHALLRAAIEAAKEAGIDRLSLSAVPDHKFAHKVDKGLRRFKTCFAPRWEPRYIAAPSWGQMLLAMAELIRLVHRPPTLIRTTPADGTTASAKLGGEPSELVPELLPDLLADRGAEPPQQVAMQAAHIDDEKNEIALRRRA